MNTSTASCPLSNEQLLQSIAYGEKLLAEGWLSTQSVEALESLAAQVPEPILSPSDFRKRLLIDAGGQTRVMDDCLDPWQREDFSSLDASWWRMVTGQGDGKLRGYYERPRGHSKSTDFASLAAWAIYASPRPLSGFVIATDREQAQIIRNIIKSFAMQNAWFSDAVDVHNYEVKNAATGSLMKIVAADAGSAYGEIPDFMILDELTHWKNDGMWQASFSSAPKKPNCLLLIATNAGVGMGKSWQWKVRESALTKSERWSFSRLEGPQASWQDPDDLEEQKDLPPKAYKRLWLNQWQVESGDCIASEDIDACTVHRGPMTGFDPQYEPFVAGLDLSTTRHHTALVVVGVHAATGKVRVAHCEWWDPKKSPTGKIQYEVVREAIMDCRRRFNLFSIAIDPHQAEHMKQLLELKMAEDSSLAMRINMMHPIPKNLNSMAKSVVSAFQNRLIELYDDKPLHDDLLKLNIVEKQSGFHLQAPDDENGHADRAIALALCLPSALEMAAELHATPVVRTLPPAQSVPIGAMNGYHAPGNRRWSSL